MICIELCSRCGPARCHHDSPGVCCNLPDRPVYPDRMLTRPCHDRWRNSQTFGFRQMRGKAARTKLERKCGDIEAFIAQEQGVCPCPKLIRGEHHCSGRRDQCAHVACGNQRQIGKENRRASAPEPLPASPAPMPNQPRSQFALTQSGYGGQIEIEPREDFQIGGDDRDFLNYIRLRTAARTWASMRRTNSARASSSTAPVRRTLPERNDRTGMRATMPELTRACAQREIPRRSALRRKPSTISLIVHHRVGDQYIHPQCLDLRHKISIDRVDHEAVDQARVHPGYAEGGRFVPERGQHPVGRPLEGLAPMIGDMRWLVWRGPARLLDRRGSPGSDRC